MSHLFSPRVSSPSFHEPPSPFPALHCWPWLPWWRTFSVFWNMFCCLKEVTSGIPKLAFYSKWNSPEAFIFLQLDRVLTRSEQVTRATEIILDKSVDLIKLTEKLQTDIEGSVLRTLLDESGLLGRKSLLSSFSPWIAVTCTGLLGPSHVHTQCAKSLQSCPTLWGPMDCSPSGSSVQGIFQARTLEWVAMPFSRGSSQPRDRNPGLLPWQADSLPLSHQGSRS